MSFTWGAVKEHLLGMGHGGTLNKVRNIEALAERAASTMQLLCKTPEMIRTSPLSATVQDDLNNYAAPSDFGTLMDLFPQDNRTLWDKAFRRPSGQFDREKAIKNRTLSIEGSEGVKVIRINWKSRAPKVMNTMNSLTGNGTWAAFGTASGVVADEIVKRNGSASIRFDVAATGDGIQNSTMTAVDLTNEDEIADVIFDLYIKNSADLANLTSVTPVWGNNLSIALWTGTAQTAQADGTAFRVGWNTFRVPWSTAVETGVVDPATVDSLKFTVAILAPISDLRIDNVRFSIGRAFDVKYYSKYLFKSTAGIYISRPNDDDAIVLIDNDSLPLYLGELLKAMAHQVEGTDAAFDINYALAELSRLYPAYRAENPNQTKKMAGKSTNGPRWGYRRY